MKGILYSINSILGIFSLIVFCVFLLESSKFNITTITSPLVVLVLVYIINVHYGSKIKSNY